MAKQAPERFNPVSMLRSSRARATDSGLNKGSGKISVNKAASATETAVIEHPGTEIEALQDSAKPRFTFDVPLAGFERLRDLLASTTVDIEPADTGNDPKSLEQIGSLTGSFTLSEFASQGFDEGDDGESPSMNTKTDDRAVKAPVIVAKGQFAAELQMQCQRCLSEYLHAVSASFSFVFAANEATANAMPDIFDPVLLDDEGFITLVTMFEEELMLQVPGFPKHESDSDCTFDRVPYAEHVVSHDALTADGAVKRENPFAALKGVIASNENKN